MLVRYVWGKGALRRESAPGVLAESATQRVSAAVSKRGSDAAASAYGTHGLQGTDWRMPVNALCEFDCRYAPLQ